jgi:hypothetical protein
LLLELFEKNLAFVGFCLLKRWLLELIVFGYEVFAEDFLCFFFELVIKFVSGFVDTGKGRMFDFL